MNNNKQPWDGLTCTNQECLIKKEPERERERKKREMRCTLHILSLNLLAFVLRLLENEKGVRNTWQYTLALSLQSLQSKMNTNQITNQRKNAFFFQLFVTLAVLSFPKRKRNKIEKQSKKHAENWHSIQTYSWQKDGILERRRPRDWKSGERRTRWNYVRYDNVISNAILWTTTATNIINQKQNNKMSFSKSNGKKNIKAPTFVRYERIAMWRVRATNERRHSTKQNEPNHLIPERERESESVLHFQLLAHQPQKQ